MKIPTALLAIFTIACHHTETIVTSDTTTTESSRIVFAKKAETPAEPARQIPAGATDCHDDLNCMISAARECSQAAATHRAVINMFDIKQTQRVYLEIKGPDSGRCAFYMRLEKLDVEFPSSVSPQEAAVQRAMLKLIEGKDGTCRMTMLDLAAMFTRWSEGTYSNDDFAGQECEGPYFAK